MANDIDTDAALGARLRAARLHAGLSQAKLGERLGVSFQQIQKYENGRNRIAAITLEQAAIELGIHLGALFSNSLPEPIAAEIEMEKAMRIAGDWQRIKNSNVREKIAALIHTLSKKE